MLSNDFRFAARTLRKHPAFTITAVLTIALGIGASTAIFSVVNALLLRPLPYAHPEQLAMVQLDMRTRKVTNFPMPPGDLPDLRAQVTAFQDVAGVTAGRAVFVGDEGKPEQLTVAQVTTNFFSLLGARIGFGRNFVESDGIPPAPTPAAAAQANVAAPVRLPQMVILSHAFWIRRFAGDSAVIGKSIQINNFPMQVIGVADEHFKFMFPTGVGLSDEPDLYNALRIDWSSASRLNLLLQLVGRFKPGATLAAAQAQLNNLAADLSERFPIKKAAGLAMRAVPMQADLVRDVRPAILALMGAVIFVLLIACANVANLLLVRAAARERELAVRSALGGSRRTLIGQMLAESLVLALLGAGLGLLFARLGIALLVSIAPSSLPRVDAVSIDANVLGFALLLAVTSAVVFGLLPAWRASRPNLAQTLRAGGRASSLGAGKVARHSVVIAEVALSFVLLVGSGLMLRSFMALEHVDPGFDPNGLLTFTAFNTRARGPGEAQAWMSNMVSQLRAIPGVTAVTGAIPLPLDGLDGNMRWGPVAAQQDASLFQQATLHIVQIGFFDAMRVKLLAGRDFNATDNDVNDHNIIIDDLLAAKAFPGQSPVSIVGKQLYSRILTPEPQMYQIVGVVRHVRHLTLSEPGREAVFVPDGLFGFGAANHWAIRTTGDPSRLMADVRRVVASVDPLVPIGQLQPMSAFVDQAMAPTRFALVLIGVFGIVAAVLAAIGLYGVLSTTVRQRTAEIGVRMAFGATGRNIFGLMIGQGIALSAIGIGVGLIAALALTGVMQKANMLIGTASTDPLTYASIALLFVMIAAFACWIPARRAALLDPNAALRQE
jgi:putative ABC transport system permease protein